MRIKFFAQEHNTLTWSGLEFRPLAPESSALTIRKMADFELDEDEEKGVFWSYHKCRTNLKNLSESHEDSNANSIDTDDALDIADLSSKQPIVSVAQWYSA